jgi:lysophospholipase L1-like esterase
MSGKSKNGRKFLFALTTLIVFLIIIESILRIAGFHYASFYDCPDWWSRCGDNPIFLGDPEIHWKLRPNANSDLDPNVPQTQAINAQGFRDDPIPLAKQPGELRIASLGDSCTFGDGVANWETYPNVLEQLIRKAEPERPVYVLNAGVPGYTAWQVEKHLQKDILPYHPDVVTIYVGFNDNVPASRGIPDNKIALHGRLAKDVKSLLGKTRTYQLLNKIVAGSRKGLSPTNPTPFPPSDVELTPRVSRPDFEKTLCDIHESGRQNGYRLIVMTLPHQFDKEPDYNVNIRAAAEKCKIPLVDLWEILKKQQAAGTKLYNTDGGHPNSAGHRMIAIALFEQLQEAGILKTGAIP